MGFSKKTIRDIDVSGKKLLVRVDYNVVILEDGSIEDDYKLRASLPTIEHALNNGASLVLVSHLGRPEGNARPELSLFPVAKKLRELLDRPVEFIPASSGERVEKLKQNLVPGQVALLENLRFDSREEANDDGFAAELASGMDFFVQDGFAVAYRAHASVEAVTRHLPSVAGLLLETEMTYLGSIFSDEQPKPLIAVISAESVHEKLGLLERAISQADALVIGGGMAATFLKVMGVDVGRSLVNDDDVNVVRELIDRMQNARTERGFRWCLPQDAVVSNRDDKLAKTRIVDWSANVIAEITAYPKRTLYSDSQVADDELILDMGPFTGAYVAGLMQFAGTVLMAGTPGRAEVAGLQGPIGPFAQGTQLVLEAMAGQFGFQPPETVVIGDDAVSYVTNRSMTAAFDHVSTGDGASYMVLAGQDLIGVQCLWERE